MGVKYSIRNRRAIVWRNVEKAKRVERKKAAKNADILLGKFLMENGGTSLFFAKKNKADTGQNPNLPYSVITAFMRFFKVKYNLCMLTTVLLCQQHSYKQAEYVCHIVSYGLNVCIRKNTLARCKSVFSEVVIVGS